MRPIAVKSTETRRRRFWPPNLLGRIQRYRISLDGYGVIALMALVGFAAWHSGTNLLYLLFSMLVAFFLIQGGIVWICLRGIEAKRILPRHVTALEETTIPIEIKNCKHLVDSYGLRIVDYLSSGELVGAGFVPHAPARSSVRISCRAVFPRRGEHVLRRLQILTRHPFGLVERGTTFSMPQKILVYPRVAQIDEIGPEINADFGEKETRAKGIGTGLFGLREYEPGEHARHIHWRSSIKAERLIVMEYEKEERRRLTLAIENTVPAEAARDKGLSIPFEKAVEIVASLASRFLELGHEVALVTGSGRIEHGSGPEHRHRIMRALATIQIVPNGTTGILIPKSDTSPILAVAFRKTPFPTRRRIAILDAANWEMAGGRYIRASA